MKIWKIHKVSFALPFDTVPVEEGEVKVDDKLTEGDILELDEKYGFKKHLGGGTFGIAFETFDGKVVKITTDRDEYTSALDLVGTKLFAAPFVTIYEAYQLDNGLFVIVKDLVTPLSEEEQYLFDMFVGEFNADLEQVPSEFSEKMPLFEEFDGYVNDVQNYTQYIDTLNSTNIGRNTHGVLVAFDPRQSPIYR